MTEGVLTFFRVFQPSQRACIDVAEVREEIVWTNARRRRNRPVVVQSLEN
jgi:hypothetical protein